MRKKLMVLLTTISALLVLAACNDPGKEIKYEEITAVSEETVDMFIVAAQFSGKEGYMYIKDKNLLILSTGSLFNRYEATSLTVKEGKLKGELKKVETNGDKLQGSNVTIYQLNEDIQIVESIEFENESLPILKSN